MLFHSPAKDLRYAEVNHVNWQCATLQYFATYTNGNILHHFRTNAVL